MKKLEEKIFKHLRARGWDNLRPSDIAKSIMIEGAELLELFQWENMPLEDVRKDRAKISAIEGELADVLIYAIEMAVLLGSDTEKLIRKKLAYVAKKYPARLMKRRTGEPGTDATYWAIKKAYRKRAAK